MTKSQTHARAIDSAARKVGSSSPRRGRPHKFGRPSQLVALTLPEDVLESLRAIHPDLGWAVVQLVEPLRGGEQPARKRPAVPLAELVDLPGRRALIVVQPKAFADLEGVLTVPMADGRAFLAFERGGGLADLEVALIDRIEELPPGSERHQQLLAVRNQVRGWRRTAGLVFKTSHIILAERRRRARSEHLVRPHRQ